MKKTIVVVGAGKGLGNGVAEKFGSNDFRVILMARSEEHLKEYAADFAPSANASTSFAVFPFLLAAPFSTMMFLLICLVPPLLLLLYQRIH